MSTHAQGEPEEPLKNAMHIKLMFIALKELCPPMHKLSKHCTLFTQVGVRTARTNAHAHTRHGTAEWSAHDSRFACRETARSARPTAAPPGS